MSQDSELCRAESILTVTEPLRSTNDVVALSPRYSRNASFTVSPSCSSSTSSLLRSNDSVSERIGFVQVIKDVTAPDIYGEGEQQAGPRPFTTPISPVGSSQFTLDIDCSEIANLYNRALSFHSQNRLLVAAQLYEVVSLTVNGLSQSSTLSGSLMEIGMKSYNNYATIAYWQGDVSAAVTGLEVSLLFARQLVDCFSAFELEYASVLSNWCRIHLQQGEINQTVYQFLHEVLQMRAANLPWDHQDVASAYFNLGAVAYASKQRDRSELNLKEFLKIVNHRAKAGMADLDPMPALTWLLLLQNEGNEDRASKNLVRGLRALDQKRREGGYESVEVASILNFIGTLLFQKNELHHALLFFREELRLEEQLVECLSDISVSVTCNNIGRIQQEIGNYEEAVVFYKLALADQPKRRLDDDVSANGQAFSQSASNLYSTVWYNLGLIHDKLGAYADAIKAFSNSLELRKAMLGNDHPDIACLYYNIGVLQMEQQQLDDAFKSFSEALCFSYHGAGNQLNDERVIKTLEKLASLYKSKGNIKGAVNASCEMLKIIESSKEFTPSKRLRDSALLLRSIAELHHAGGDMLSALSAAKSAVDKFNVLLMDATIHEEGKESSLYSIFEHFAICLVLLGSLYHELSEPIVANHVLMRAVNLLQGTIQANQAVASRIPSSIFVLLDVAAMLAHGHCAPKA